jgi:hypothetical protein
MQLVILLRIHAVCIMTGLTIASGKALLLQRQIAVPFRCA